MTNIDGTPSFDFLQGTLNNDTMRGLTGNDTIQGLGGNDLIFGNQDSDSLLGNEGADTLFGGQGNDTFYGSEGNDIINGDRGQDFLIDGEGTDILTGGVGDDLFVLDTAGASSLAEADAIADFGKGSDRLVLTGGLKFGDLDISFAEGNAVVKDRLTGKYLAVLQGVNNLIDSNFISLIGGIEQGQILPVSTTTNISGNAIGLEVAQTPIEQAIGLMYRSELPDNRGMLFPIEPPRNVKFWMRNVPIALDMIFLREGVVQAVIANAQPCFAESCPTYGPDATIVDGVIELRGGRAAELGLKVGDRVF